MAESRLASKLGCTDGQVWTLGLALALAVALVPATFPAGLRPKGDTVVLPAALADPVTAPVAVPPVVVAPAPAPAPLAFPGVLPPIPLPGQPYSAPQSTPAPPAPAGPAYSPAAAPPPSQALRVASGGWYDSDSEAAARAQLTPPGELPVSADHGSRAASSLLRLSGNDGTLVLTVDPTPGRTAGSATLELCRNATSTWTAYDAEPPSAAPPVDKACVAGTAAADRWTFPVGQLGPPDAGTGFTLRAVVTGAPSETFAVTFFREST